MSSNETTSNKHQCGPLVCLVSFFTVRHTLWHDLIFLSEAIRKWEYSCGVIKFYGQEARNAVRAHRDAVDNIGLAHRFSVVGYNDELGFFSQAFEQ